MIKTLSALAAAAIVAAAIAVMPGFATQVDASVPAASKKADRLDLRPVGTKCSQKAWPYFENGCLRNAGNRTMPQTQVRIVSVDRR